MMDLQSTISRLRHDLVKHLDRPRLGEPLTTGAWRVLQRRLYGSETGVVTQGRMWVLRLRNQWAEDPTLSEAVDLLWTSISEVERAQEHCEQAEKNAGPAPQALFAALAKLDHFFNRLEGNDTKEESLEDATLDFLLGDDETKLSSSEAMRRVLVVDDRLLAIERFHAIPHLRDRFEWVTLCELPGPCWRCPHQADCNMKRARTFRELEGALQRAQSMGRPIDVVLMDVRFDDIATGELLPTPPGFYPDNVASARSLQGPLMVRALHDRADLPQPPVVLMTSRETLPAGAEKLLQGLDGLHFVDDEASIEALTTRLELVASRASRPLTEGGFFWGRSQVMQNVRDQIELVSLGPRPVLLTGPSGSGKSFLVEEVLLPLSRRAHLVTLDLSALPETLVESELFGHVKGAFSGAVGERKGLIEEADGGILFIDEIGHLTHENQRKLLLFLQDRQVRRVGASHRTRRPVDVKVVAATHLDLEEEVESGRFRFDLFMRLRPATQVRLPSLAQRPEDLDGMMRHIIKRLANGPELHPFVKAVAELRRVEPSAELIMGHEAAMGRGLSIRLPLPTVAVLKNSPWSGNTRELESVLDTLVLRALADARRVRGQGAIVEVDHYLALQLLGVGRDKVQTGLPVVKLPLEPSSDLKQMRHRLERTYLVAAFRAAGGDMERMTELILGAVTPEDRHRITVRMNQLGLKVSELKHST